MEACICTLELRPVCAGGKTFDNPCGAACAGFNESEMEEGACDGGGLAACSCMREDNPVCDEKTGTTYASPCLAACDGRGEGDVVEGECNGTSSSGGSDGDLPVDPPVCPCSRELMPVCVTASGESFASPCLAMCEGYSEADWTKGRCSQATGTGSDGKTDGDGDATDIDGDGDSSAPTDVCMCPKIIAPVCARTTNTTYGNLCLAECAGLNASDVERGECGAECGCPEIYNPLCDTYSNITYDNVCFAMCAGEAWRVCACLGEGGTVYVSL